MVDDARASLEARVRNGDPEALGELIEANRSRLMSALDRKVGAGLRRKLDLDDIFQEVVARSFKDLAKVDFGDQDPMGWLYQIMDRQIIDLHRFHFDAKKRDASREVSADQPVSNHDGNDRGFADLLIASMTSPSAVVSRDMRLMRVYEALNRLSDDMQNAIRWRYLDNLTSQEVAKRLGKSDVATRVLLSRAIRKLQGALSEPAD